MYILMDSECRFMNLSKVIATFSVLSSQKQYLFWSYEDIVLYQIILQDIIILTNAIGTSDVNRLILPGV